VARSIENREGENGLGLRTALLNYPEKKRSSLGEATHKKKGRGLLSSQKGGEKFGSTIMKSNDGGGGSFKSCRAIGFLGE